MNSRKKNLTVLGFCLFIFFVTLSAYADEQNIAGRWFVGDSDSGTYLYEDGIDLVDLFSYHTRDNGGMPFAIIGEG